MLGRTANDLFWLARSIERAENMARLTEVGYRLSLLPRAGDGHSQEWQSTLASAGCIDAYLANTLAAAPDVELIHPGVQKYMRVIGLLK